MNSDEADFRRKEIIKTILKISVNPLHPRLSASDFPSDFQLKTQVDQAKSV